MSVQVFVSTKKRNFWNKLLINIIGKYNLVWTSIYALKCKRSGHILANEKFDGFKTIVFCTRRGCKFSHVK